jgi:signal transduction histidine kinase
MDRFRGPPWSVNAAVTTLVGPVLIAWGLFETLSAPGSVRWTALGTLGMTVPLLWARRLPLTAALVCFGTLVVHEGFGADVTSHGYAPVIAALFVSYATGRYTAGRRAALGAGLLLILTWLSVVFGEEQNFGSFVITAIIALGPWLAGVGIRDRQERVAALTELAAALEREREQHLQAGLALERAHMARELHDVLAHSVTVMVVQAEAAEDLLERRRPEETRRALQRIQDSGRAALQETRKVLATLRERDTPMTAALGLADIGDLVEAARADGLTVGLDISGDPTSLPPGKEASVYRIVQEALTNIRKHADARCAEIRISLDPDMLQVEVADDGGGPLRPERRADGSRGLGLIGMRERVSLYGGELYAGADEGRGFVVRARIPVESVQA